LSDSEVAGNSATGHVTNDSRKKSLQLARAILKLLMSRNDSNMGAMVPSWSLLMVLWAGVADPAHRVVNGGDRLFWRGSRKGIAPGVVTRAVQRVRVAAVFAVAMELAFGDCVMLGEEADPPSPPRSEGVGARDRLSLCVTLASNWFGTLNIASSSNCGLTRQRLMPAVRRSGTRGCLERFTFVPRRRRMAKQAKKQTARGRKQDRARVAGGQDYEVGYEAKKSGRSAASVKKAVKKVGNSRKRVEKTLARKKAR
jgi:hypothetical protein